MFLRFNGCPHIRHAKRYACRYALRLPYKVPAPTCHADVFRRLERNVGPHFRRCSYIFGALPLLSCRALFHRVASLMIMRSLGAAVVFKDKHGGGHARPHRCTPGMIAL